MKDSRCFIQFIHPGGGHRPDSNGVKYWNMRQHRRKFLKSCGRYIRGNSLHEGELVFWGEWEPESRVVAQFDHPGPGGPRYIFAPYYTLPDSEASLQNTDPFVFGDAFHYTGCLQHTKKGSTQLRNLSRGSVVLFGSCFQKSQFMIDTVLVVADHIDHSKRNWHERLADRISETYRIVTMDLWYKGNVQEGRTFRLYFGATPDKPVSGMYSFFPCLPYEDGSCGFARPIITLPGFVTPHLTQGKKIARALSDAELEELWQSVVQQVTDQGLYLGVHAALPSEQYEGGRSSERERVLRRDFSGRPIAQPSCGGSC